MHPIASAPPDQKEFRDPLSTTAQLARWGIDLEGDPTTCEEGTRVTSTARLKGKLGRYTPVIVPQDTSLSHWIFDNGGYGIACESSCLANDAFVFVVEACAPTPENLELGCQ